MSWFSPRWLSRQDLLRDLVIGVILTVYLCAATTFGGIDGPWEVVRDVAVGAGVALRRVWTIPAFLLVATATFINEVVTWPYSLGVAIMLYTLAAENYPRWLCWTAAALGVVAMVLPWPQDIDPTPNVVLYLIPEAIFLAVLPVLVGSYTQARQVLLETFAQRSADEERARRLEAERIRADERNRLANEIHDVVAHRVSLMVVHTGALKLSATDERTKEIAELVRSSGRRALEELREVVGVLRSEDTAPLAPTATLANLSALLDEARSTGVEVEFHEAGQPRKLAVTVERTAYRVVQESLTNARKHAPGAPITVQLTWGSSTLDLSILNDKARLETAKFPESGHGLESLRERAALISGRIETGPISDGGWMVRATLPYGIGGGK